MNLLPNDYCGILVIGDPHLEGRVPGFRKDDYPRVILEKLRWSLQYARDQRLLPAILGDLFHVPRDNPNWLIVELLSLFEQPIITIYGNHDVRENQLSPHDSLSILIESERLILVGGQQCVGTRMSGRPVVLGGTSWGCDHRWAEVRQSLAAAFPNEKPIVIWMVHEGNPPDDLADLRDYADSPADLIVNGHIHHSVPNVRLGTTTWITPGNISRRNRSDLNRTHQPAVLRIDFGPHGWSESRIPVPHQPFDEVFHAPMIEPGVSLEQSAFVAGLAELQARRTETGEGLLQFLRANLQGRDPAIVQQIEQLAQQVLAR